MTNSLEIILKKEMQDKDSNKIFLCIGSKECIGDSLGPRVGEILKSKIKSSNIYVIGNLKYNVNYINFDRIINRIYKEIKNPRLIIIDSALADKSYIGKIIVNRKSIIIAQALDKKKYSLGDIYIKGIVGENLNNRIDNFNILNNISSSLIRRLSYVISEQIIRTIYV